MASKTDPDLWHRDIRLPPENYLGCRWYFVTICTHQRRTYFRLKSDAEWLLRLLKDESAKNSFQVRAYCLMPDHLHLLLQGISLNADLMQFIAIFKQRTTHNFWTRKRKLLWQLSFYDHILRSSDAPADVAWYIWMNPVRAGLALRTEDYPFCGPFVREWAAPALGKEWAPPLCRGSGAH